MKIRVTAGGLLLLAAVLHAAVTAPLRSQAATASEQYRRARDQRRDARSRLAEVERRDAARARAEAVLAAARSAGGGVREVRRGVVELITGSRISAVRLGVRPGRPPASATVGVSAEGSFIDVIRFAGELARPDRGLVLERVRLVSRSPRVALELGASSLGTAR